MDQFPSEQNCFVPITVSNKHAVGDIWVDVFFTQIFYGKKPFLSNFRLSEKLAASAAERRRVNCWQHASMLFLLLYGIAVQFIWQLERVYLWENKAQFPRYFGRNERFSENFNSTETKLWLSKHTFFTYWRLFGSCLEPGAPRRQGLREKLIFWLKT